MVRVVRPGGRVVVLEITTPTRAAAVDLLRAVVRPRRARRSGALAGGAGGLLAHASRGAGAAPAIADAYTYLPNSVKRFPGPRALAAEMERAGLEEISYLLTAGGIVAIHAGTVAAPRRDA